MSGSHTHHGSCIELLDREGFGKGTFDDAVAYNLALPDLLIAAILEADQSVRPARMAVVSKDVPFNRNRQMKREPKVTDPMLALWGRSLRELPVSRLRIKGKGFSDPAVRLILPRITSLGRLGIRSVTSSPALAREALASGTSMITRNTSVRATTNSGSPCEPVRTR